MVLVSNTKAHHEYTIEKTYTAGLQLTGQEVKSLRLKHASLAGSYVRVVGGEAILLNAQINAYKFARIESYDPKRTRKLLLHQREIDQITEASNQKGWGVIPLNFSVVGRNIKLTIGVGKGKKLYEKREVSKQRTLKREMERAVKWK